MPSFLSYFLLWTTTSLPPKKLIRRLLKNWLPPPELPTPLSIAKKMLNSKSNPLKNFSKLLKKINSNLYPLNTNPPSKSPTNSSVMTFANMATKSLLNVKANFGNPPTKHTGSLKLNPFPPFKFFKDFVLKPRSKGATPPYWLRAPAKGSRP